jgi:MFS family permease
LETQGSSPLSRGLRQASRTFGALAIPAYRYFWLSAVTSTMAMQVQMFARALLAYELGGNASSIGIVILSQAIPQMSLAMVGGTMADRFERRLLMIAVQAAKVVVAIAITVMVIAGVMTVAWLFVFGLFQGFIIAFSGPARQSFVPEIVGRRQLMNAIALNNSAQNLSRIGAPSLAAAVLWIPFVDIEALYVFQAVLDVVALVLLVLLPMLCGGIWKVADRDPSDAPPRRPPRATGGRAMVRELMAGYTYVFRSPILLTLLAIGLVPTFLGQSYQQYLAVFAKDVFGNGIDRNEGAIGLMGTMAGVGALIGSLTVASLADYKRRTLLQLGAGVGFGLFMTAFAVQNMFAAAVIALIGVGFMTAFLQSLNATMIMSASDPAYHGRVMSVNMLNFSLVGVGAFAIGYVIDWIGHTQIGPISLEPVQAAYAGVGLLITAFMLSVTVFNPSYRHLEQDDLRRFGEGSKEEEAAASAERAPEPARGSP